MKAIFKPFILILALSFASFVAAADPVAQQTYDGEVADIVCSACAAKVKAALSKLDGVTGVTITKGSQPGLQKVRVVSTSRNLTKQAAVKSLGDAAAMYDIRTFALTAK